MMLSTILRTAALISGQTTGENEKRKRFKEPARAVRCISGLFNAVELTFAPLPVAHVFCWTRGENPLSQLGVDSPLFFSSLEAFKGWAITLITPITPSSPITPRIPSFPSFSDYSEFSDSLASNP